MSASPSDDPRPPTEPPHRPGDPATVRDADGRSPRLTALVDDDAEPATMTVFPACSADTTTRWLTVDLDAVIDLQDAV